MNTTIDKLLNGLMAVEQPAKGFRIAVDTLLLASAVQARAGERALDLGCGVGGVMIALAVRVPGVTGLGVELQEDLAALCASNIRLNGLEERLSVLHADLCGADELIPRGGFDHVMANPPYHEGSKHGASANDCKRLANTENESAALPEWIARAVLSLKEGGVFTMIHRADRQEEITALLRGAFGSIAVKPLWSKADGTCKRVIFRARKGGQAQSVHLPPLILYGADGRYSPEAHAILRDAAGMG